MYSPVVHALFGGMMGFLWIQSGWMSHDSSHYRVVSDPCLNRLVQIVTGNCLTNISITWWKRNHNAHQRKISPFVKELCKNHKLPYFSASFSEANKMTLRTLRAAALRARDFVKPVQKNLVWEAVNTHG